MRHFSRSGLLSVPCSLLLLVLLLASSHAAEPASLTITNPWNDALFPADITAPTFRWKDAAKPASWRVTVHVEGAADPLSLLTTVPEWRPTEVQWEMVKKGSMGKEAIITVAGTLPGTESDVSRDGFRYV